MTGDRARRAKKTRRPAVFLDRDGVLVRDVRYLSEPSQLAVLAGVPRALRALRAAGFTLVVVTNQSGVARGYFSLTTLGKIHRELKRRLARSGARWDALYFSPHGPDSGHPWRKPGIGMLKAARKRFNLDLKASYFVGDSATDVQAARKAGCVPVLVGRKPSKARPDKTCRDLGSAARWILSRRPSKSV